MPSGGRHKGKIYGFPLGGMCTINRECKLKPIHDYYKQFKGCDVVQYVGIAHDEKKRLARLKNNQISLLDKYCCTEDMAKGKCLEYGLLSPIYGGGIVMDVGSVQTSRLKTSQGSSWHIPTCGRN